MFGIWEAVEVETIPVFETQENPENPGSGDNAAPKYENIVLVSSPKGAVYKVPANEGWRLHGAERISNASSIPLQRAGTAPTESTATVPIEAAGSISLRQSAAGNLFADGLPLTRDGQQVGRRVAGSAPDVVFTAMAAELDGGTLRLLWWDGKNAYQEWRLNRGGDSWLFASVAGISAADAEITYGIG